MKIESYTYGQMTIDGQLYKKDLIIFPDRIIPDWWRKEGHLLSMEDLGEVIEAKPEVLIVGTGDSGFMHVPLSTELDLKDKNVEVIVKKTDKAVQLFNEQILMGKNVAGAFHLTC